MENVSQSPQIEPSVNKIKDVLQAKKEEPKTEAKVESKVEVKEEVPVSARIAAIAKKEKELLKKEKEAKKIIEEASRISKNKDSYKKDANLVLSELGLTFEEFTDVYLNSLDGGKKKTAEEMVKDLEKKLEEKDNLSKEQSEKQQQAYYEEQVSLFKKNLKKQIDSGDKYILIKDTNSYDTVFEVIEAYFADTGEYLDIDQAAEEVEKEIEEQYKKLSQSKKFKKEEPKKEEKKPEAKSFGKTLSNTAVSATDTSSGKLLSNEESLKKAASLLKFR